MSLAGIPPEQFVDDQPAVETDGGGNDDQELVLSRPSMRMSALPEIFRSVSRPVIRSMAPAAVLSKGARHPHQHAVHRTNHAGGRDAAYATEVSRPNRTPDNRLLPARAGSRLIWERSNRASRTVG